MIYKKRVSTKDPRFKGRVIMFVDALGQDSIPIDDTSVICNGCNRNIFDILHPEKETFGWFIYLSKAELKADKPYDIYCDDCTRERWAKAIEV